MNKKIFALTIALTYIVGGSTIAEAKKGAWNDVPSGFALAKKTNKPIITDFYTDWCGWCKKMEHDTFENSEVEKFMNDNFVLVRANAEDKGAGESLARQNRIDGYPTIIIFDSSGQPKARLVGYQPSAQFKDELSKYLAGQPVGKENQ